MNIKNLSNHDYITIAGIGSYCMVTPSTVRRWIKQNKLLAFKLPGGHYRVTVPSFKEFLKQNNIPLDDTLINKN
jgi:excisionase family DNA binding protein